MEGNVLLNIGSCYPVFKGLVYCIGAGSQLREHQHIRLARVAGKPLTPNTLESWSTVTNCCLTAILRLYPWCIIKINRQLYTYLPLILSFVRRIALGLMSHPKKLRFNSLQTSAVVPLPKKNPQLYLTRYYLPL